MSDIRGPWLELQSGKRWYVMDPQAKDVDIQDIASALSKVCRFGGHTRHFYSVAQHCVLGAEMIKADLRNSKAAFHFLLHDASEAYLVDIPRPVKQLMPTYKELEDMTQQVIAEKFNLDFPFPAYVHEVDNRMLVTEQRDLLPPGPPYTNAVPYRKLDLTNETWDPGQAQRMWLGAFNLLKGDLP
jgi:hypothetical protein